MGANYYIACKRCRCFIEIGRKGLLNRQEPVTMLALEKFLFDHLAGAIGCELFFFGDDGWAFDLVHDNGYEKLNPETYLKKFDGYTDYLNLTPGFSIEEKICPKCKSKPFYCECEKNE